jgi:hypothetical protein
VIATIRIACLSSSLSFHSLSPSDTSARGRAEQHVRVCSPDLTFLSVNDPLRESGEQRFCVKPPFCCTVTNRLDRCQPVSRVAFDHALGEIDLC